MQFTHLGRQLHEIVGIGAVVDQLVRFLSQLKTIERSAVETADDTARGIKKHTKGDSLTAVWAKITMPLVELIDAKHVRMQLSTTNWMSCKNTKLPIRRNPNLMKLGYVSTESQINSR